MPNPRPKLENLKSFQKHDRTLSKTVTTIRFQVEVFEALSNMENRVEYIRQAVEEKLIADGLL